MQTRSNAMSTVSHHGTPGHNTVGYNIDADTLLHGVYFHYVNVQRQFSKPIELKTSFWHSLRVMNTKIYIDDLFAISSQEQYYF